MRLVGKGPGIELGLLALSLLAAAALWLAAFAGPVRGQSDGNMDAVAAERLQQARDSIARAEALSGQSDFGAASRRAPELAGRLDKARQYAGFAEQALERARSRPGPSAFEGATVLAERARREAAEYAERVEELFAEIELERNPPPSEPPSPEPPSSEPPSSEPPPPQAQTPSSPSSSSSTATATEPVGETTPPSSPGPSATPASSRAADSAVLRRGLESYLRGDYAGTIRALESAEGVATREIRARALAVRGAARFALFLLDGEEDYSLRGRAADDVVAARAADPALTLAPTAFSARFRDFVSATE